MELSKRLSDTHNAINIYSNSLFRLSYLIVILLGKYFNHFARGLILLAILSGQKFNSMAIVGLPGLYLTDSIYMATP